MKNESKKIKIKGIPFGVLLAGKVHDGSKTVTRRVVKMHPEIEQFVDLRDTYISACGRHLFFDCFNKDGTQILGRELDVPYAVGQLLYVREPWRVDVQYDKPSGSKHIPDDAMVYWEGSDFPFGGRRRIARFMPARFARTFLRVTAVRCERLGVITDYDAIDEGIDCLDVPTGGGDFADYYRDYSQPFPNGNDGWPWIESEPVKSFASLWDHINHRKTDPKFADNPWVWVISFERVEMANPWNKIVPQVLLSNYGMASWIHPVTGAGYVVNLTAAVGGWVWKIDNAALRVIRKSVLLPTEREAIEDLNGWLRLIVLNPDLLKP